MVGMTVAYGLGYVAVCLRCDPPQRLRVIMASRSDALHLLEDHDYDVHGPGARHARPA